MEYIKTSSNFRRTLNSLDREQNREQFDQQYLEDYKEKYE